MTGREAAKITTALASKMSMWATDLIGYPDWNIDEEMNPESVKRLRQEIQRYADMLGGENK